MITLKIFLSLFFITIVATCFLNFLYPSKGTEEMSEDALMFLGFLTILCAISFVAYGIDLIFRAF